MALINLYDFSDKINASKTLREEFITKYVEHLVNNMDTQDIINDWVTMVYTNLYDDCRQDGADELVQRAAHEFPDLLEKSFNVDTSLVKN